MELRAVPLLSRLSELYERPRDRKRFRRYLYVLTADRDDMPLPAAHFNPMGGDHVRMALHHLRAIDADGIVRATCAEAAARLRDGDGALRVALVLADDIGGMWTERAQSDLRSYREVSALVERGWAPVWTWTSERPDAATIRRETLRTAARAALAARHGDPRTLDEIMAREGAALRFAGAPAPSLDDPAIVATRAALAPHRRATHDSTLIPALAGDEMARAYGYVPLGVARGAALTLALTESAAWSASAILRERVARRA